jgi:hypothetical protein
MRLGGGLKAERKAHSAGTVGGRVGCGAGEAGWRKGVSLIAGARGGGEREGGNERWADGWCLGWKEGWAGRDSWVGVLKGRRKRVGGFGFLFLKPFQT